MTTLSARSSRPWRRNRWNTFPFLVPYTRIVIILELNAENFRQKRVKHKQLSRSTIVKRKKESNIEKDEGDRLKGPKSELKLKDVIVDQTKQAHEATFRRNFSAATADP
jgi:hypothetical protein